MPFEPIQSAPAPTQAPPASSGQSSDTLGTLGQMTHDALRGTTFAEGQQMLQVQPGPPQADSTPAPKRMLRVGSRGADVAEAQTRLNASGASPALTPDGIFGPLTQKATVTFQRDKGLSPDGIIGPKTHAELDQVPLAPPGTQPPGTQPPGTQPPGTQPPGTQPPGTQPPGTQPPGGKLDSPNVDPRIGYDRHSQGPDNAQQALPFNEDLMSWDGAAVLSQFTQIDRLDDTTTDQHRCGANGSLAVAIMRGPTAVSFYAMNVATLATELLNRPNLPADRRAQWEAARAFANQVQDRLNAGTATFGDMSRLAHHAKMLTTNPQGHSNDTEILALQGGAGLTIPVRRSIRDRAAMDLVLAQVLQNGDSLTVGVDINTYDPEHPPQPDKADHLITIGKDQSGRVYLYDPMPRKDGQMHYSNSPSFWTLFEAAGGEWKGAFVIGHTVADPNRVQP